MDDEALAAAMRAVEDDETLSPAERSSAIFRLYGDEVLVARPAEQWQGKIATLTAAAEVVIAAAEKQIAALQRQLEAQAVAIDELRTNYTKLATVRHLDVQRDEDGVATGYLESSAVVWPGGGRDFDAEFAELVARAEQAGRS